MDIVELEKIVAKHGLEITAFRRGAGNFHDLYIGVGATLAELHILREDLLVNKIGCDMTVAYVDEPLHKDYRKPMLEIHSFWWAK